jgi:hypothetical protein
MVDTNGAPLMPVYFIRGEKLGLIKIGITTDTKKRLGTLQVGSPDRLTLLATVEGDEKTEQQYHLTFKSKRVFGEWFALENDDLAAIGVPTSLIPRPSITHGENWRGLLKLQEETIADLRHRIDVAGARFDWLIGCRENELLREMLGDLQRRLDREGEERRQAQTQLMALLADRRPWWRRFQI